MAKKDIPVARFTCPICSGAAELQLQRKSWADDREVRHYFGTCTNCGQIRVARNPDFVRDVVCGECAGRLSWTSDLDTGQSIEKWPWVCAHCALLSNSGLRLHDSRQLSLLARIHALDAKHDKLWLNAIEQPPTAYNYDRYQRYATERAQRIEGSRAKKNERLKRMTLRGPNAERVFADDCVRRTTDA